MLNHYHEKRHHLIPRSPVPSKAYMPPICDIDLPTIIAIITAK